MTEQILFDVSPIRDGRSYITREVQAKQDNEVIFVMIASFHVHEPGFEFQRSPEELAALMDSQGLTHVTRAQDLIDGGQVSLQGGTPNTPRLQLYSGSNHSLFWRKHEGAIRDDSDRSWIMHSALLACERSRLPLRLLRFLKMLHRHERRRLALNRTSKMAGLSLIARTVSLTWTASVLCCRSASPTRPT